VSPRKPEPPRRRVDDALREAETTYRTLVEQSLVGFYIIQDGRFRYVNPKMAEIFGYSPEEIVESRTVADLVAPADRGLVAESLRKRLDGEVPSIHYRFRGLRRDCSIFDVEVLGTRTQFRGSPAVIGTLLDTTEQRQAETAIRESARKFRTIVDFAPIGIYQSSPEGRILLANESFAKLLGYSSPQEILGKDMAHDVYLHPEERRRLIEKYEPTGHAAAVEVAMKRKDGSPIWARLDAHAIMNADGQTVYFEGFIHDISERKQAERAQSALYRIAEKTSSAGDIDELYAALHAIVGELMDARNFYIALHDASEETLAFPYVVDEEDAAPAPRPLKKGLTEYVLRTGRPLLAPPEVFEDLLARGEVEPVGAPSIDWLGVPLKAGSRTFGVVVVQSYTESVRFHEREKELLTFVSQHIAAAIESKRAEEEIRHLAFHDALTGLPNRLLFHDRLSLAVAQAHRSHEKLGVMFLDMDRFKVINDSLGHRVGDQLLRRVAVRVAECLREGDTLARLGGDEFILLLPALGDASDAAKIARKILDTFRRSFDVDGLELYITASIGISLYPHDGRDADTLVKNADIAMYRAKERGRDNSQLYTSELNARAIERMTLESSLRQALTREEFEVFYQPQVQISSGRLLGAEALVWWHRPDRGLVLPAEFISLAEETGLILPLGAWVLSTACRQMRDWERRWGLPGFRLAVNLSARQFLQQDLVARVGETLRESELDASRLDLEITESAAMDNPDQAIATLRRLKKLGVRISMDDFGTGYSSLASLKRFPIDALKIDKSFIADVTTDDKDAAVVRAIISLGHGMGLEVLAEGVETQEQREHLAREGCDAYQGFLFSRPIPAGEIESLLSTAAVP
jgi:diguanylate cyclase (GGDEF)-like protein/PAS domain S-box-containing protein